MNELEALSLQIKQLRRLKIKGQVLASLEAQYDAAVERLYSNPTIQPRHFRDTGQPYRGEGA